MGGNEANERDGRNILVVDDDQGIRFLIRAILEPEGYRVTEAEDGAEALAAIVREAPDLVLLDLMMPRTDGWLLLDELRREGLRERVRVAIVSALADEDTIRRSRREGVRGLVAKPFDAETLLDAVRGSLAESPEELLRSRERIEELIGLLRTLERLGA